MFTRFNGQQFTLRKSIKFFFSIQYFNTVEISNFN